ncbi:MAG TPA: glycosyltransferase [Herpetosiphonaceae bacterium]
MATRSLRILHVYKDYFPVLGGMENHLRILGEGLAARGHQVTAVVSNTSFATQIEQRGGVMVYKAAQWLRKASTPVSPGMLRLSWGVPADIIHLHHPFPPGDLLYWLRFPKPKLVISYQSDIVRQRRLLQLYRPLLTRTLAAADRILVHSPQYIASSPFLQPNAGRCTVVPLSVDAERFANPDPARAAELRRRFGERVILFVGRFRYYKGLHFLIEALPAIPDAALVLVGVGPEEERLRAQAAALGVADRIHWEGEIDDAGLPDYFAAADLFVLPSHLRSEAFGIVQTEALASGLPLVSTELGTGTSFVNEHGKTGFVVPPADPPALARAISVLLANPELRRAFGAFGRRRARERFAPETLIDSVEQTYLELCSPPTT